MVAPYVGAWIETLSVDYYDYRVLVAPYVGAWIETILTLQIFVNEKSHPTWVRGLKPSTATISVLTPKSHPTWVRGLKLFPNPTVWQITVAPYVGAWIETVNGTTIIQILLVAPYVGAWIETPLGAYAGKGVGSRTLRGCVD